VIEITQDEFLRAVPDCQRLIMTVCLSFTHNYFDAEDLTQETFLAAYRSLGRFDGRNLRAWLTTIAANKCRDYLRSPQRCETQLTAEDGELLADPGPPPAQAAEQSEADARVRRLCGMLREPYRTVAAAYFCGGEKLSELALRTGQNKKTLETQLYRAKKLLAKLLRAEDAASVCPPGNEKDISAPGRCGR
jgi:RNA polymerase sigma-70 factor (ECF subfamily)